MGFKGVKIISVCFRDDLQQDKILKLKFVHLGYVMYILYS